MSAARTLFVGIGSAHGDDQAGWLVARRLAAYPENARFRVREARTPIDLLDWLTGNERLIVCDACRGLSSVGQIARWTWPAPEIAAVAWSGTHDLSLPAVLSLAGKLGRLSTDVILWGIEASADDVAGRLSPEVSEAVSKLVAGIIHELAEVPSAPAEASTSGSCDNHPLARR